MMFQSNETFGAYCVFSSHDNVGFVGEDFFFCFGFFWQGGEWVVGKFHINLVGSKQFFHILKGFLNKCSNLYVTNFNLLLDLKCFGEFFVLNL